MQRSNFRFAQFFQSEINESQKDYQSMFEFLKDGKKPKQTV